MRVVYLSIFILAITQDCLSQSNRSETIIDENKKLYYSQVFGFNVTDVFNDKVFDLIADWISTPYKYAGKNEKGVDCSGFVNIIFKNVFGLQPGINSLDMFEKTRHIKKNQIKPGDLVFFKTRGRNVSHVGIYLGNNKFAHASTSNGVVISDLEENYYAKRFAKGGRIL